MALRGPSRRTAILVATLAGTFAVMRGSMMLRPDADLTIAGYNIHHLFTGVLVATICAIPLVLASTRGIVDDLLVAGLGVGLSLALDEVIYLIATDGSNASYLTRVSWIGGVVLIVLACIYAIVISRMAPRTDR